jgi:hypothetical protein
MKWIMWSSVSGICEGRHFLQESGRLTVTIVKMEMFEHRLDDRERSPIHPADLRIIRAGFGDLPGSRVGRQVFLTDLPTQFAGVDRKLLEQSATKQGESSVSLQDSNGQD